MTAGTLTPPDPPLTDGVVLLRPWVDGDVEQIFAACQDPAIQKFIPIPKPYTRADAEAYVARTKRQWADGSKAAFAIVDPKDDTVLLGAINVAIFDTVGNSGYWVSPAARHRGVATSALRLLTEWALHHLELGVVILEIRPDNDASLRVAASVGFHESGHLAVNTDMGKKGGLLLTRLASDA